MKICLKCRKIFEADMQFCTEDGNFLVNRDYCAANTEKIYINTGLTELSEPTIVVSSSNYLPAVTRKSKRNLHIGLLSLLAVTILLSGGFVWAGINIVAASRAAEKAANSNNTSVETPKLKRDANQKIESNGKASDEAGNSDLKTPEANKSAATKFNGRVIMLNAVVRAAPTMEAETVEVLPLDAPVIIGSRASANSPWFRVETASGAKGWMHGNTIEFN